MFKKEVTVGDVPFTILEALPKPIFILNVKNKRSST